MRRCHCNNCWCSLLQNKMSTRLLIAQKFIFRRSRSSWLRLIYLYTSNVCLKLHVRFICIVLTSTQAIYCLHRWWRQRRYTHAHAHAHGPAINDVLAAPAADIALRMLMRGVRVWYRVVLINFCLWCVRVR